MQLNVSILNKMDWITEHIAIGGFKDMAALKVGDVDAILCLKDHCCDENNDRFDIVCIPLIDGPGNDPRNIQTAVDFIHDVVSNNEKILVHCHAGRSRSVCIVALYLVLYGSIRIDQALDIISAKREIYLSPGIEEIFNVALHG